MERSIGIERGCSDCFTQHLHRREDCSPRNRLEEKGLELRAPCLQDNGLFGLAYFPLWRESYLRDTLVFIGALLICVRPPFVYIRISISNQRGDNIWSIKKETWCQVTKDGWGVLITLPTLCDGRWEERQQRSSFCRIKETNKASHDIYSLLTSKNLHCHKGEWVVSKVASYQSGLLPLRKKGSMGIRRYWTQ